MTKANWFTQPCSRKYTATRNSGTRPLTLIKWLVVHCTETRPGTAENVARYFASKDARASTHLVVDDAHCFRTLLDRCVPWGAPGANTQGFHVEHVGFARWSRAEWLKHDQTLRAGAYKMALRAVQHDIPIRWVGAAGLRAGRAGLTTHKDVCEAFGKCDHTDPGPGFPQARYLGYVKAYAKRLQAPIASVIAGQAPTRPLSGSPPAQIVDASWRLPGPVVFTASDPDATLDPETGKLRAGVRVPLIIATPGECPVWRTRDGSGYVYQAEGLEQAKLAVERIKRDEIYLRTEHRAVVTTLGIDPAPFLELGVTTCFVELNAQAGWEPYGNRRRLVWQAQHEGWPDVWPSYGIYLPVSIADYRDYAPDVWDAAAGDWKRGTMAQGIPEPRHSAFYLAEGIGDTGSWRALAALV